MRGDSCCWNAALDQQANVCRDCGKHIVRCSGFSDCRALLYPGTGHCHDHVQIKGRLQSQLRALSHDDSLSLDLELTNTGFEDLEITRAWTRLGQAAWREEESLRFHSLRRREQRSLSLHAGVLSRGRPTCEIAVACMGPDLEEFLFGAQLRLSVGSGSKSVHIEINNSTFAAGAAGVIGNRIGADYVDHEVPTGAFSFDRNEGYELHHGIRGYRDLRARIRRDSVVELAGAWADRDKSSVDRPFVTRSDFYLGRNRPSGHVDFPREGQLASLRFYDERGELLRERSMELSGRQLRLSCRNDRVLLKSVGRHPALRNEQLLEREVEIQHGDVITLPGRRALSFRIHIAPGSTPAAAGSLCLERL